MSDLFRGRSSTWSSGTPATAEGDPDSAPPPYGDYNEATLAMHNTSGASNNNLSNVTPIDQNSGSGGGGGSVAGFHYSPASTTTTELGSQEFHTNRRMASEKTPESGTTSDCNNNYNQGFYPPSSPQRSTRDWNNSGGSGFPASNFSVLSVASSSPFGRHPDGGGSSGLLNPYENNSPYANGSCCPEPKIQCPHTGMHSGSPSSVGSLPQPGMRPSSGAMNSGSMATTGSTNAGSGKRPARRNPWGSETYSDLIAKAIDSYPEKQATLQQIYDYISTNYTYFRERSDPPASAGWKVGILFIFLRRIDFPRAQLTAGTFTLSIFTWKL